MTTKYEIERIDSLSDNDLKDFIRKESRKLSKLFNNTFNHNYCAIESMIQKGVFLICRRDGLITGCHISWLFASPLDVNIKILQQQIFYVKKNSGRTAYHLFKKFIDIGKSEAHHIITMIGEHTNVKPSTLNSWGFEEIETLYRMKV